MKIRILITALVALSLALAACDYDGAVDQGRAVAYEINKNVTLVLDTSKVRNKPVYNGKTVTYKLPVEAIDMGPEPVFGGLLAVNPDKKTVSVYDAPSMSAKELPVEFTDVQKDIGARHPLVVDKKFPVIDKEKQTVTVYVPSLRSLATFNPGAAIAMPDSTWKFGDEVRVAYKNTDKAQSLRLMNVSKTNIFNR
ncbi:MAG: DUF4881 domain-containing protein [Desulfovibrio sp.]|jgi:hypothetical protein|nr:DUF4881 domain-containing protein [Desulfovibrio sp.]